MEMSLDTPSMRVIEYVARYEPDIPNIERTALIAGVIACTIDACANNPAWAIEWQKKLMEDGAPLGLLGDMVMELVTD